MSKTLTSDRPNWHEYFLMLAFTASLRSEDKFVRHGAIIVDKQSKHLLGSGYNACFRGSNKSRIPLFDRNARRAWMIHAEENAIMNSSVNPLNLPNGAIIFTTGTICVNCLQRVINFGIHDIVMADQAGTITEDEKSAEMRKIIIESGKVNITTIPMDNYWVKKVANL